MKCVSETTIDEDSCLPKCSGLQISSFLQDSIEKNKELLQDMDTLNSMQLNILSQIYYQLNYLAKNYVKLPRLHNLPASLTSWSRYYLSNIEDLSFKLPEFSKNTKLQDLIENLSQKYWNYKGYYNLGSKGNKIVNIFSRDSDLTSSNVH